MTTVSIFINKKEQFSNFVSILHIIGKDGENAVNATNYVKGLKFEFFNTFKVANDMMNSVDVMQINVPIGVYLALELVTAKDF